MISLQDIEFLKEFFPTKEEMDVRFNALDRKFNMLITGMDKVMKELIGIRQEMSSLHYNDTVIKKWMKPVSGKTGVEYPF